MVYQDKLLERISLEIKTGNNSFDAYTVGQVVEDIFEGALVSEIEFIDALEFFAMFIENAGPYFGHWNPIFNTFNKLEMVLKNTKYHDTLMVFHIPRNNSYCTTDGKHIGHKELTLNSNFFLNN